MKKKRALRITVFLVLVAAGFLWFSPYHRQLLFGPKIQGVPLCAWQEECRRQLAPVVDDESFIGKVRNWLMSMKEPLPWEGLAEGDKEQIYLSMLDDADPNVRTEVAVELGGIMTASATRGLLSLFDDDHKAVREKAAFYLGYRVNDTSELAAEIKNKLSSALQHADSARRKLALTTLNNLHPRTKELLGMITSMLQDADRSVRAQAATCLSQWKGRRMAAASTPQLLAMLKDEDALCRVEAAHAAWCVGKRVDEAVAALRQELSNPDDATRLAAAAHLRSLRKDARTAFAELDHAARHDPSPAVRAAATLALGYCGKKAIPTLLACLRSTEADVRRNAVAALGEIGPDAADTAPAIFKLIAECDLQVLVALQRMKAKALVPSLIAMLEDPKQNRNWIMETLGSMGTDAQEAVPHLLTFLEDEKDELRVRAAATLAQIEDNIDRVLPVLLQTLDSTDTLASLPLAVSLDRTGAKLKPALPELLHRLRNKKHPQRSTIVLMLAEIGPDAEEAIPDLLPLLKPQGNREEMHSYSAAYALGAINKRSEVVVPALCELLSAKATWTRMAAIEALGKFGPRAMPAIPSLTPFLDDDDLQVSEKARVALGKIDPQRFPAMKLP